MLKANVDYYIGNGKWGYFSTLPSAFLCFSSISFSIFLRFCSAIASW